MVKLWSVHLNLRFWAGSFAGRTLEVHCNVQYVTDAYQLSDLCNNDYQVVDLKLGKEEIAVMVRRGEGREGERVGGRGGEGDRTGKEGRTLTDGVSMIVLKCVCL